MKFILRQLVIFGIFLTTTMSALAQEQSTCQWDGKLQVRHVVEHAEIEFASVRVVIDLPERLDVKEANASLIFLAPTVSDYGIAATAAEVEQWQRQLQISFIGSPRLGVEAQYVVTIETPQCPTVVKGLYAFSDAMSSDSKKQN